MKTFFIFFALFFSVNNLWAADRCEQVPALTCSPGYLNDGTGVVSLPPSVDNRASKILKSKEKEIYESFLKSLKKANTYELQYALSATGSGATEECEQTLQGLPPSEACYKLTAQGLRDRVLVDLVTGRDEGAERRELEGALKDEYPLRQTDLYRNVSDKYLKIMEESQNSSSVVKHLKDNLLPKIKKHFNTVISKHVSDPKQRKMLINKVQAIRFGGVDCSDNKRGGLNSEFSPNAFYLPDSNKFYFCKGIGKLGMSDFNAVHIISHELAHSIDPCIIQEGPSFFSFKYKHNNSYAAASEFPFTNLISCLRDPRSISAQPLANLQQSEYGDPPPGGDSSPLFCEDQIGESFCDWVGTEILNEFSKNEWKALTQRQFQNGLANIWRFSCTPGRGLMNEANNDVHPPTRDRLTKITLNHPGLRQRLGCSPLNTSRDIYCDKNYRATSTSYDRIPNPNEEEVAQ